MYQWHGVGNPTDLPIAAGSASPLESRNRGEKRQKQKSSGAGAAMVSASSRTQERSGQGLYRHSSRSAFKKR